VVVAFRGATERARAVEDLKAAPEVAKKLLSEKLDSLRTGQQRCRQALAEMESAGGAGLSVERDN